MTTLGEKLTTLGALLSTLGAQLTTKSDAPNCGVTHNSRGIIYDHNIFILQAKIVSHVGIKGLGWAIPSQTIK